MWPLWVIIAVAVGSAAALTTFSVLGAVYIERRRHKSLITRQTLDRSLSQYHRPHLSITDVDFSSLPRPVRHLRHSLQGSRRDSRFYSMMSSEVGINAFPDGTAESLAEASYITPDTDRSNQWLSPSKSKKVNRKKKSIKLSISAPMARSPMSAITEQTESTRVGSPEPVELPTQCSPKTSPVGSPTVPTNTSSRIRHVRQPSIDSIVSLQKENGNCVSARISHGNAVKSRSISMGSIAPPPDCPLPPVPERLSQDKPRVASLTRSKSDLSAHVRSLSLLNSPLTPPADSTPHIDGTMKREHELSRFDFGLPDDAVQVIRVDIDPPSGCAADTSQSKPQSAQSIESSGQKAFAKVQNDGFLRTIDASRWNSPRSIRNVGCSTPNYPSNVSEPGSRPVSAISAMSLAEYGMLHSTRSSPTRTTHDPPSRPISISSIDIFRRSVVGPDVPVLVPDSPRNKGHKRQNCIRISGLTPLEVAKKRISSQLDRLAEAEETDSEDNRSVGIEIPTISPARPINQRVSTEETISNTTKLEVPKIRQPQALSLRTKRPGLLNRVGAATSSPTTTTHDEVPIDRPGSALQSDSSLSPPLRPSNPLHRSNPAESRFIYAGSPSSDPTKARPQDQEYSPVSPPTPISSATTSKTGMSSSILKPQAKSMHSAASGFAAPYITNAPIQGVSPPPNGTPTTSPRRNRTSSTLYGPRSAPPPSLRIRNNTIHTSRNSPRLRQTSDQRSTSPIRKVSQSKTLASTTQQRNRSTSQEDLRKSIALLRNLTYAAVGGKGGGLDQINVIRKSDASQTVTTPAKTKELGLARTPSSHYGDSPVVSKGVSQSRGDQLRVPRQRSKTIAGISPPILRQEATYPPDENSRAMYSSDVQSRISIWEDASMHGDSDSESLPTGRSTGSVRRKHSLHREHRTRDKDQYPSQQQTTKPTSTSDQRETPSKQLQKESLWKLQQNADLLTSRALAFNHNINMSASKSPKASTERPRKLPKPDELATKTQSHVVADGAAATSKAQRDASKMPGLRQRQRSHTVATTFTSPSKSKNNGTDKAIRLKTREGVGLGVDFGRTGLGRDMHDQIGRASARHSEDVVFLNEMERDGIGRLR